MPDTLFFHCEKFGERLRFSDCIAQQGAASIDMSHPRESRGGLLQRTCFACAQGRKIIKALPLVPLLKESSAAVQAAYLRGMV